VFSPIFICEPEIFEYKGFMLEDDIFPKLAKKELLNGYVNPIVEVHIHNEEDLKMANAIK
jgi:NDP-sugar pyrophosphorylase family protein